MSSPHRPSAPNEIVCFQRRSVAFAFGLLIEPLDSLGLTSEGDQPNRSGLRRENAAQIIEQARLIVLGTVEGIQKTNCVHASCRILADVAHLCKQMPESTENGSYDGVASSAALAFDDSSRRSIAVNFGSLQ